MLLAVDIGNTNIVVGAFERAAWSNIGASPPLPIERLMSTRCCFMGCLPDDRWRPSRLRECAFRAWCRHCLTTFGELAERAL